MRTTVCVSMATTVCIVMVTKVCVNKVSKVYVAMAKTIAEETEEGASCSFFFETLTVL